ncbi:capsule biosynthesis protein [Rhodovarius crocodyli]|nr:capsular biosynthesis protein [Rhodovarius crocodyli]
MTERRILFLQGPISPFFWRLGQALAARGHIVSRINVCLGDRIFWPGPATDYAGRLRDWPGFIADYLDRERITDILLLGEQRPYHRIAIAAARQRGIQVAVTDFGYIRPDWIILERDGMNRDSHFPRDPAAIMELARELPPVDWTTRYQDDFPTQARWDMLFHLANMAPWPFPHFERFLKFHPIPTYIATGWHLLMRKLEGRRARSVLQAFPSSAPFWIYAMQMETDYSIRAYSPYPDMDTPIEEAIQAFAQGAPADSHLIVKVHPLDPGLKRWRFRIGRIAARHGVAGRVHYFGTGRLDDLIVASQGVITVNSTVGIRALQLGQRVHAQGEAIYRIQGLSHLGRLRDFWTSPLPDPALADAFLRCLAHCLHVRGVYYAEPGLTVAVEGAAERIDRDMLNQPMV